MNDINYFEGIVKILENPGQSFLINNNLMTEFRAQLPQARNTRIINLIFWGNLASDISTYYKMNDYILIEGYFSLSIKLNSKRIEVTVLKVYPFMINSQI